MCSRCNKNPRRVNYIKNGVKHYRSLCWSCTRGGVVAVRPLWALGGYKKKTACDVCGFHARYSAQTVVYHINGNLKDVALHNLRTVCLNCVEVVKRTQINWRRGDLEVD